MEINKQLFENVLSGKLKGVFVLRNGHKFNSAELKIDYNFAMPYIIRGFEFFETGKRFPKGNSDIDIVDFIPDIDMKENELTIEIPDNKVVDWDESKKQNKIIFKEDEKPLTYKDICIKLSDRNSGHFYIDGLGDIEHSYTTPGLINTAPSEHQLECILAKNMLATVAIYLNDGWKPLHDNTIVLLIETKTGISAYEVINGSCASDCGSIWFKSKDLARQAIKILGEETVKLALEPLGI